MNTIRNALALALLGAMGAAAAQNATPTGALPAPPPAAHPAPTAQPAPTAPPATTGQAPTATQTAPAQQQTQQAQQAQQQAQQAQQAQTGMPATPPAGRAAQASHTNPPPNVPVLQDTPPLPAEALRQAQQEAAAQTDPATQAARNAQNAAQPIVQQPIAASLDGARFTSLDRDGNGFLSDAELRGDTRNLTFGNVDADGDLRVSGIEWDRAIDFTRFETLDRNNDGMLTAAEAHVDLEGDLDFSSIDTNGNSQIEMDEWRRRTMGIGTAFEND